MPRIHINKVLYLIGVECHAPSKDSSIDVGCKTTGNWECQLEHVQNCHVIARKKVSKLADLLRNVSFSEGPKVTHFPPRFGTRREIQLAICTIGTCIGDPHNASAMN